MPGEKYKPDENQHARGPICRAGRRLGRGGSFLAASQIVRMPASWKIGRIGYGSLICRATGNSGRPIRKAPKSAFAVLTGFYVFELDEFPATVSFVEQLHKQGDLLREYRFNRDLRCRWRLPRLPLPPQWSNNRPG